MTSNFKRTLQAALAVVAVVVGSATEARAETSDAAATAPAPSGLPTTAPGEFIDAGQWLLSVEHLFGYTYAHQSNHVHASTFTLLGDSEGAIKSFYDWPRLSLDTMVTRSISVGLGASFVRRSDTRGTIHESNTGYEGAFRLGYAMMLGPWVGIWPRAGVTYAHETGASAVAVTLEGLVVAAVLPHLLVTIGPVADIGVWGHLTGVGSVTYLNIGAYVGLAVPF